MNRMYARFLVGAAVTHFAAAGPASAQTTFNACRVPAVGVIYMVGVTGAPTACLDASHIAFSWTEGGAPADNSITSAKILDGTIAAADHATGSVTTTQILDGTIAAADHATGSVTTTQILDGTIAVADHAAGSVNSSAILDGSIATADLANGSVTQAKLGVTVWGNAIVRQGTNTSLTTGAINFVTASCLSGEVAVGGGATNGGVAGIYLTQSYPQPIGVGLTATGWGASLYNLTGSTQNGAAWVVCVS